MSVPAGFWRRCAAYALDQTVLMIVLLPLGWPFLLRAGQIFMSDLAAVQQRLLERFDVTAIVSASPMDLASAAAADPAVQAALNHLSSHLSTAVGTATIMLVLVAACYFIGFEASTWQATPGKRWLGLRVCTLTGQRPGLGRTMLRFFAGSLSWLSLNLGHALAAWTPRKQALHDLIAGTLVVIAVQTTTATLGSVPD